MSQTQLSKNPYKGARDFYPEDKRILRYIFDCWIRVVESYGYEQYDAPLLEDLAIYTAKSGQEIINEQTYSLVDKAGRKLAIRPEMTPSVTRMVAKKRQELIYPLRLYSIPNLWRYERQQKGRFREHWQLNVDLFSDDIESANFEILEVSDKIFKSFKASRKMYQFHVNDRSLTDYFLKDYLKLNESQSFRVIKLIDRFHKLDLDDFINQLDLILSDQQKQNQTIEKLLEILNNKNPDKLPKILLNEEIVKNFIKFFEVLKANFTNLEFDSTIVRGFDYYTGFVFEVYDTDPDNNRSMMGGGRYDNLLKIFDVPPIPTIGFGLGDATMINFILSHGLLPNLSVETDLFYVNLSQTNLFDRTIINYLRDQGIRVYEVQNNQKLAHQIKKALKKHVPFFMAVGEDEISSRRFKLKNLITSQELELSLEGVVETIRQNQASKF